MVAKPFLFLTTRPEEAAVASDYASFCRHTGLTPDQLVLVRVDQAPLPEFRLSDYSGIILGGSPLNTSDSVKSESQQRIEADLDGLVERVLAADFPFFGACFGIGVLGLHLDAVVDGTYGEPISAPTITVTGAGRSDPLLAGLPARFQGFVGHKEALTTTPRGAVVLAGSDACPIQMFRVGRNVYATQFHPELDYAALVERVRIYLSFGYVDPAEADEVLAAIADADVETAHAVLRTFVEHYATA